jgi:hypothetical protein
MGSTVLTGKRAAAFQKADGEWIYALFMRTFESNVYPHTDRWSAFALGNFAQVMRLVFSHAANCEGGMLRSRAGRIKPENFIESFRRELTRPSLLRDRQVELSVSSGHSAIPASIFEDLRLTLIRRGFKEHVEQLSSGKLTVSLHSDIELLRSIYGSDGPLSAWRILSEHDCGTLQVDVATPASSKTAMDRMPQIRSYAIDAENRLVAVGCAPWRHAGWQYSAVGTFINDVAYPVEMEVPGFAKKAIPAFRARLGDAADLPSDTRITVTRAPEGVNDYQQRRADELARKLEIISASEPAPAVFSFEFATLLQRDDTNQLLYLMGVLVHAQLQWDVPVKHESATPDPSFLVADAQLSFCLP